MNQKLFSVCEKLDDDMRKKASGLFFNSIHGTLNHLLLTDRVWLGRFTNSPFQVEGLDQELYANFDELYLERCKTDQNIENWTANLDQEILDGVLEYKSLVNPQPRKYKYWIAVTHFFNHQTHHRGQITGLLSQLDIDYGVTDLLWLPSPSIQDVI
tara:strand:+ start:425425 stop:425892 length:468 start_codon:yes stop_codon:yes gene_type:complete